MRVDISEFEKIVNEAINNFGGIEKKELIILNAVRNLIKARVSKDDLSKFSYSKEESDIICKLLDNYDFWNLEAHPSDRNDKKHLQNNKGIWSLTEATYRHRLSEKPELSANDLKLLAIMYEIDIRIQGNNVEFTSGGSKDKIKEDIEERLEIIKKIISEREQSEASQEKLSETAGLFGSEGRDEQPRNVENYYN